MADHFSESEVALIFHEFRNYDTEGDGTVPVNKVGQLMLALGHNPTVEELDRLITFVDTTGEGVINFPEFLMMLGTKLHETEPEEDLRQAFRIFDKDGNGNLSSDELRKAMLNLGEKLSKDEVDEMIKLADIDGDGQVNYEEFIRMMFTD